MKKDQVPECWIEANDGYQVCYVMEYGDEENMFIEENERYIDDYLVIEVVRTCRMCGSTDVSYPV